MNVANSARIGGNRTYHGHVISTYQYRFAEAFFSGKVFSQTDLLFPTNWESALYLW